MDPKESRRWAAVEQLFAGISAGVVTTICTHPLDLIKTRLQGTRSFRRRSMPVMLTCSRSWTGQGGRCNTYCQASVWRASESTLILSRTFTEHGGQCGELGFLLYVVVLQTCSSSDTRYGEIKKYMSSRQGIGVHELSSAEFLAASGTAGIATAVCTNPFWVVKTRMVVTDKYTTGSYTGLFGNSWGEGTDGRWITTDIQE